MPIARIYTSICRFQRSKRITKVHCIGRFSNKINYEYIVSLSNEKDDVGMSERTQNGVMVYFKNMCIFWDCCIEASFCFLKMTSLNEMNR